MKRLLLLAVLAPLPVFAHPSLELEVGGGATAHSDFSPTFTGRLGVDFWEHFTPSLKVLTLTPLNGDHQAWAMLGDFRVHTSGRFQVSGALGVGFGTAVFANSNQGLDAHFFDVQPWLTADVGARVMLGRFWIGVDVGGMPWSNLWLATLNVGVAPFGS